MSVYLVKNTRKTGSWSFITAGGTKTVQAGETAEIEMTQAEAENGKAEGIEITGGASKAENKPSKPAEGENGEGDETAALRASYEAKFGKKPFMGWDADTLRQKMAEAE